MSNCRRAILRIGSRRINRECGIRKSVGTGVAVLYASGKVSMSAVDFAKKVEALTLTYYSEQTTL